MSEAARLEIAKQDGPGRICQLEWNDFTYTTPNLAWSLKHHLAYAPSDNLLSFKSELLESPLIIVNMPSWQFFGMGPEIDFSIALRKMQRVIKEPENSIPFVLLPQDAALVDQKETSPYISLYSAIQNELGRFFPLGFVQSLDSEFKTLVALKRKETALISLYNISSFLKRPKFLLNSVNSLQRILNSKDLIYAPAVPPFYFPLLNYIGIDVFDAGFAIIASRKGYFLTQEGLVSSKKYLKYRCTCAACSKSDGADLSETILKHNFHATEQYIINCRRAIQEGNLWDLVRRTAVDNPEILAALRLLKEYHDYFERNLPIVKSGRLLVTAAEDLWRPEVERYRQRIKERYLPPDNATACIILPCSARKPYSLSKSHKRFSSILKRFHKRSNLIALIFTSPLGVVPRTLEKFYPAADYDIPVTGDWTQAERDMINQVFHDILGKFSPNVPVLVHLNQIERAVLQDALRNVKQEVLFSDFSRAPHSDEGLQALEIMMMEALEGHQPPLKRINEKSQILIDTISFQFGKETSKILFNGSEMIKGKPHIRMQAYREKELILTYSALSGMVTLSWPAAERLMIHKIHSVHFDGIKLEGSTLFCSAIIDTDNKIRPGDEVVIVNRNEELVGIGRSILSSRCLVELERGAGIKIRHKRDPKDG